MPRGARHVEARQEGAATHRVVHHLHAASIREPLHLGGEVVARVDDHLVGARGARQRRLLVGARRADDPRAATLCDLHEQQPHATRRRVHETAVALAQRPRGGREIVRGHPLQHDGRADACTDAARQWHQLARGHDRILGVRAERAGPGDAIAGPHLAHLLARRHHGARAFLAERRRQRDLVEAGALVDVDEVDAARLEPDERFTSARMRDGNRLDAKRVGSADGVHAHGAHRGWDVSHRTPPVRSLNLMPHPPRTRRRAIPCPRTRGRRSTALPHRPRWRVPARSRLHDSRRTPPAASRSPTRAGCRAGR